MRLVDYENAGQNEFLVVNQFSFTENGVTRRPDVLLFVNGLPLVLMELKSPSQDEVGVENAYRQIRNYMQDIPSLFYYNAICVISDLSSSRAGTITAGLDRFMEWKRKDPDETETAAGSRFDTFFEGMFRKERLLDILENFILFSGDGQKPAKILAGYHQYFAVKKAIERAKVAAETRRQGRRVLAYPGQRQIPVHGVLCPSAAKGAEQPDDCGDDRPHRPGRPAVFAVCAVRGLPASGPGPGGKQRAPEKAAGRPPGQRDHLHHHVQV